MNNEPGTGSFPTMGTSAATLANVGKPERGRMRPKGGAGKTDKNMGTASHRSMSYERMGSTLRPVMKMYEANEPCASDTQRHLLKMPSRGSWTDNFRAKAKYGRAM